MSDKIVKKNKNKKIKPLLILYFLPLHPQLSKYIK